MPEPGVSIRDEVVLELYRLSKPDAAMDAETLADAMVLVVFLLRILVERERVVLCGREDGPLTKRGLRPGLAKKGKSARVGRTDEKADPRSKKRNESGVGLCTDRSVQKTKMYIAVPQQAKEDVEVK